LVQWGILLLLALVLRSGAALFWQRHVVPEKEIFYFGDSYTYYWLGQSIAEGKSYQFQEHGTAWQIFRMPGYPVLIAPILHFSKTSQTALLLRFYNIVFGTLLVAAVGFLAFQLFRDHKTALLAGFFVAIDPCTMITSVWVLSEPPFCLVIVLQMASLVKIGRIHSKGERFRYSLLFGTLHAAAVSLRPSWLYFAPMIFVFCFLFTWKTVPFFAVVRKIVPVFFLSGAVFCILLSPWWVRNYRVSGHFVMTTLQMGASLYDGLSPAATGASDMTFTEKFRLEERRHATGDPADTEEYRLDRRMKQASLDWAKNHPGQVLKLAAVKFCRLWNVWPNEPAFSRIALKLVIFFSYVPVMLTAFAGIFRCRKQGVEFLMLLVPAVYVTSLHVIFVSSLRYRVPVMPFFMIFAASWLMQRRNVKKHT
jgi:hypothetical protein